MLIYGIDFTSAPSPRKPLLVMVAERDNDHLRVRERLALTDFAALEALLNRPGEWVAGLDFPFGQPRPLLSRLGWETTWAEYVRQAAALGMVGWLATLQAYRDSQAPGHKQPRRRTDTLAGALSPMMIAGTPIGRMFLRGAPLLERADLHIPPCRPMQVPRTALETYPGLAARRWLGGRAYKSEAGHTQADTEARRELLHALMAYGPAVYGVRLELPPALADACLDDGRGDTLDALLCAVQAAWAATQPGYGVPPDADPLEGWIIDPILSTGA